MSDKVTLRVQPMASWQAALQAGIASKREWRNFRAAKKQGDFQAMLSAEIRARAAGKTFTTEQLAQGYAADRIADILESHRQGKLVGILAREAEERDAEEILFFEIHEISLCADAPPFTERQWELIGHTIEVSPKLMQELAHRLPDGMRESQP